MGPRLGNGISPCFFAFFLIIILSAWHNFPIIAERISVRLWIEDLFSQSTYVRTCVCTWWVTLRNVTRNVVTYHRQGLGMYRPYVHHTVWHIQIRSTQIDCGRWHSLAIEMEVGDDGTAWPSRLGYYKHQTASFSYSKRNTCHARLTCTHIWSALIVCALARGKDAHAYS